MHHKNKNLKIKLFKLLTIWILDSVWIDECIDFTMMRVSVSLNTFYNRKMLRFSTSIFLVRM